MWPGRGALTPANPRHSSQRFAKPSFEDATMAAEHDILPAPPFALSDVYRAAARARRVGRIEASDAKEAIEAAAVTFDTDVRKLIAVQRREIA